MVELPAGQFTLNADIVLLALGFQAVVPPQLAEQLHLATENGRVALKDYATAADGVFVAGDLEVGPSRVATAIHSGRQAAERIDAFLTNRVRTPAGLMAMAK